MKRGNLVIVSLIIVFLVIIPLASANVFTNFWDQITGHATSTTCIPSDIKTISVLSTDTVNGLSVGVTSISASSGSYLVQLKLNGLNIYMLVGDLRSYSYNGVNYNISVTNASSSTATIKVSRYCSITTYTCTDSDGGVNFYTKGTVTSNEPSPYPQTATDYCSTSTTLQEMSCGSDGMLALTGYDCPNGCLNGACVANSSATKAACTDSDNSPDYSSGYLNSITPQNYPDFFTQGVATGDYQGQTSLPHLIFGQVPDVLTPKPTNNSYDTYIDHCASSQQLNEGYCNANGDLEAVGILCPSGCLNGACVVNNTNSTVNV